MLKFWPFHAHRFALVATHVSPPLDLRSFRGSVSAGERALHGFTTRVWKCADEGCGKTITNYALGVPEREEPEE